MTRQEREEQEEANKEALYKEASVKAGVNRVYSRD